VLLVPAGNGRRLGIDRDEDGLLDGTELEAGSDPAHPDSDRDGYSDGQEIAFGGRLLQPDERLAADVDPPRVLSCRVIGRFASTATLDVVTDEPCSVEVEVGPDGERARRVVSFPLRRHHQIALEGLSAGRTNRYALRLVDRSGNSADEPVVGEFDAGPLALHVGAMEMLVDAGSPRTVVRVVDQDGRPAAGLPVRVLWHLASGRDPRASAADRVAVAVTSQDGEAEFRLDRLELPAGRVSVTLTVLGLGSEDPEHAWFAGRRGETPRFFYEQPLNVTNAVSVLLL